MGNESEIGTPEGRMCGHLAASLCMFFAGPGDQKGGFIGRTCPSDWVLAEEALLAVGVMHMVPVEWDRSRTMAVFSMNAGEMPDFLAASIGDGDPRIAQIVRSFVAIACGYGDSILSDEREWFEPPPKYVTAMKWLARHGYAEPDGIVFRWTDKIGPAMRASYLWNDRYQSIEATERIAQEAECELIWATMPDTLKQRIRAGRVGFFELVRVLALGWKNGQWNAYRSDDTFELSGQTVLAGLIMQRSQRPD